MAEATESLMRAVAWSLRCDEELEVVFVAQETVKRLRMMELRDEDATISRLPAGWCMRWAFVFACPH